MSVEEGSPRRSGGPCLLVVAVALINGILRSCSSWSRCFLKVVPGHEQGLTRLPGKATSQAAQRHLSREPRPTLAGASGSDSLCGSWGAALGLASCLALRALSRLRLRASWADRSGGGGGRGGGAGLYERPRFQGGGGGGGFRSGGFGGGGAAAQQEAAREAKRSREAAQFFTYQKRIIRTGIPPRDDLYWSREEQLLFKGSRMKTGINFDQYDEIDVERRGGRGLEDPVETFQDCCDVHNLPGELTDNINRCEYNKPTPVQKHSMPAALVNTDVMVAAQTGSGKTAAFLVPLISGALRAGAATPNEGPVCPTSVILAPTRELCQQITVEARKLCFRTPVRIVSIYGGADAMPQLKQLAEGCELAICTPGRLEDFLGRGVISMSRVKNLVLDEADRMLDMGFEPQIRQIVEAHDMPRSGGETGRQTMMFSATFPKEIQDLALDFLDPTYLWIGVGRVGTASSNVDQRFVDVSVDDDQGKFGQLMDRVKEAAEKKGKTLIFANSKSTVDDLAWRLSDSRIRTSQIHGGLTQAARDRALNDFRNGRVGVLVATDVAARGLDLPGIDHVINYELPLNSEDYVHRIGRTGRIGNTGVATSFVSGWEPALRDIVRSIKKQQKQGDGQAAELPGWLEQQAMRNSGGSARRYGGGGGGGGYGGYGGGRGGGGGYRSGSAPPRGRFMRDEGGGDRGGYGGDRGGYGRDRGGYGRDRGGYRSGGGDRFDRGDDYGGGGFRRGGDRFGGGGDRFGGRSRSEGRGGYGGGRSYGEDRFGGRQRESFGGGGGPRRGSDEFGDDTPPWARGLPPKRAA